MSDAKKKLIILTGPTAVGKTDLSIRLAKAVNGEIISADSIQVYRKLDIGSAKITADEMQGIPHHLVDVLDPAEGFHVAGFQAMAKAAIDDITSRGKLPIIVGGTGFYIQSVLYDIDFGAEDTDGAIEEDYLRILNEEGPEALHAILKEVDPASAEIIHANNIKRVLRALTFYKLHGRTISSHNETERKKASVYNSAYFVLTMDRARLYERIDKRVDLMMSEGLLSEVEMTKQLGIPLETTSMQGIGYKELRSCLDGEITLEEAVELIKKNTRHFAKRQLTWFRREKDVIWLDRDVIGGDDAILAQALGILHDKNIM